MNFTKLLTSWKRSGNRCQTKHSRRRRKACQTCVEEAKNGTKWTLAKPVNTKMQMKTN